MKWSWKQKIFAGVIAISINNAAHSAQILTGYIIITEASSSTTIGYISNVFNEVGEYVPTDTATNRLSVTFSDATSLFSMTAQNNADSALHPEVGGITGFDNGSNDLGSGSSDYAYLGGTDLTAPSAHPATGDNTFTDITGFPELIESSMWSLSSTNLLTAAWVNTIGSTPANHIEYIQGLLVLSGDPTALQAIYGPATEVLFNFVETGRAATGIPEPLPLVLLGVGLLGLGTAIGWRRRSV